MICESKSFTQPCPILRILFEMGGALLDIGKKLSYSWRFPHCDIIIQISMGWVRVTTNLDYGASHGIIISYVKVGCYFTCVYLPSVVIVIILLLSLLLFSLSSSSSFWATCSKSHIHGHTSHFTLRPLLKRWYDRSMTLISEPIKNLRHYPAQTHTRTRHSHQNPHTTSPSPISCR